MTGNPGSPGGIGKRALVLAGGGIASAVFEIGCLRALDDYFQDFHSTEFDVYVGVSAGAVVASLLANGVSGDEMFKALIGASTEVPTFSREMVFRVNRGEILAKLRNLPQTYYNAMSRYVRGGSDLTLGEALFSLTEVWPTAFFEGSGIEEALRTTFEMAGRSNSFRDLKRALFVSAVNLNTGETRMFGRGGDLDVPISRAVMASTALPALYKPARVGNDDYVDGAVDMNLNIEAAVEAGATLIIAINPYVPIFNDPQQLSVPLVSGRASHLSQKGIVGVLDQVFRIMIQKRNESSFVELMRRHPDIDVITLQPARNDYRMFFYNAMRFSARIVLAEYGFITAKNTVDRSYDGMSEVFSRHGITLNPTLVEKEYEVMRRSRFSLDSVVKILGSVPFIRKQKKEVA
ncbi:MAG: patatin-like phospholipase family protein [Deltaproteobacteria bacterium]|nr:patatin-like phospholipase family protein [Deltaproteobacteria bacterium]